MNMLKEGWDVNNLYTIVPLRTAASKILREQMVGRGLRLPYGERTGDRDVDAVMLTAHDKFNDILAEAQRGDSIFKAGNIIKAEELKSEEVTYTQLSIETDADTALEDAYARTKIEKTDAADYLLKKQRRSSHPRSHSRFSIRRPIPPRRRKWSRLSGSSFQKTGTWARCSMTMKSRSRHGCVTRPRKRTGRS